ncbi:hypothetical protein SOPP22_07365 [Shewanella sp. OPT22]|nr:hypothetical protein SOPP22_07365 [Shewanella sp. OPT22]
MAVPGDSLPLLSKIYDPNSIENTFKAGLCVVKISQHYRSNSPSSVSPEKLYLKSGKEYEVVVEGDRFGVKDLFHKGETWFFGDDSKTSNDEQKEAIETMLKIVLGEGGVPSKFTAKHLSKTPAAQASSLFLSMAQNSAGQKPSETLSQMSQAFVEDLLKDATPDTIMKVVPRLSECQLFKVSSTIKNDQIVQFAKCMTASQLKAMLISESSHHRFGTVMRCANPRTLGEAFSQIEIKEQACNCFKKLPYDNIKLKLLRSELNLSPEGVHSFIVNIAGEIVGSGLLAEFSMEESVNFYNVLASKGTAVEVRLLPQIFEFIGSNPNLSVDSKVQFVMALSPNSIAVSGESAAKLMCKDDVRVQILREKPAKDIANRLAKLPEDQIHAFCKGEQSDGLDKKRADCLIRFKQGVKVLAENYCDDSSRWQHATANLSNDDHFRLASMVNHDTVPFGHFLENKSAKQRAEGLSVVAREFPVNTNKLMRAMHSSGDWADIKAELLKLPASGLALVVSTALGAKDGLWLVADIEAKPLAALLKEIKEKDSKYAKEMAKSIAIRPDQVSKLAACEPSLVQEVFAELNSGERTQFLESLVGKNIATNSFGIPISPEQAEKLAPFLGRKGALYDCWAKLTPKQQQEAVPLCSAEALAELTPSLNSSLNLEELAIVLKVLDDNHSKHFSVVCSKLTGQQFIGLNLQLSMNLKAKMMLATLEHTKQYSQFNAALVHQVYKTKEVIQHLKEPALSKMVGLLEAHYPNELKQIISKAENADFLTNLPSAKLLNLLMSVGSSDARRLIDNTDLSKLHGSLAKDKASGRAVFGLLSAEKKAVLIRKMDGDNELIQSMLAGQQIVHLVELFAMYPETESGYASLSKLCFAIPSEQVIQVLEQSKRMNLIEDSWRLVREVEPDKFLLHPIDILHFKLQDMKRDVSGNKYSEDQLITDDLMQALFTDGKCFTKEVLDLMPQKMFVTAVQMNAESDWCKHYLSQEEMTADKFEELCAKFQQSDSYLVNTLYRIRGIPEPDHDLELAMNASLSAPQSASSNTEEGIVGEEVEQIVNASSYIENGQINEAAVIFKRASTAVRALILSELKARDGKICRPGIAKDLLAKVSNQEKILALRLVKDNHMKLEDESDMYSLNQMLFAIDEDDVTVALWKEAFEILGVGQRVFVDKGEDLVNLVYS